MTNISALRWLNASYAPSIVGNVDDTKLMAPFLIIPNTSSFDVSFSGIGRAAPKTRWAVWRTTIEIIAMTGGVAKSFFGMCRIAVMILRGRK
jgi:hypothetical protein